MRDELLRLELPAISLTLECADPYHGICRLLQHRPRHVFQLLLSRAVIDKCIHGMKNKLCPGASSMGLCKGEEHILCLKYVAALLWRLDSLVR